ncbi:MAG TPA: Gfo/Idh/MocA family oxidoreductase [Acidimicrobiia bacterium]|nr:Gfo/Idh/MocA family oxidoreductase [Acidimicrobiia bacterium]
MSSDSVRLASIGLGWWGKVLADGARAAGAEIVGAYARARESRDEFTASYGGRGFDSYEQALETEDVDGILLATPHLTHADLIRAAAEAGKHVFVEKPLTLTVASAKSAVAAAEQSGVVLQVGHDRRRQPANRKIKQLIEDGELGTVTMVETQQSTPNALGFGPDYWRANHQESPLGGMTSMGVHMVDTMTYLLGPIERVSAFSKEILDHPPIDHATTIIFEFASGPLGYLGTSFVVPRTTTITVRGTKGSVTNTENGTRFLWQASVDDAPREQEVEILDTVADELGEFVRSIRGEATPETGGAEGTEVVAVLEAAVASSESGRPVAVDDFR